MDVRHRRSKGLARSTLTQNLLRKQQIIQEPSKGNSKIEGCVDELHRIALIAPDT